MTKGQIFAEFVLEALIKNGIPRFKAYRDVQRIAFYAHKKGINYIDAIKKDKAISSSLSSNEIKSIFHLRISHYGMKEIYQIQQMNDLLFQWRLSYLMK